MFPDTLASEVNKLRTENAKLRALCLSALAISKRYGVDTNWEAFANQLDAALDLRRALTEKE